MSRNYGAEQEHLNNVEGASLKITGLRLAQWRGVEFLEYLAPADGRPYPADARANDLRHWQTTVVVAAGESVNLVATSGVALVSRGATELAAGTLGFRRAVVVRDPDGHVMQVVER